jgi:hypothetical protein
VKELSDCFVDKPLVEAQTYLTPELPLTGELHEKLCVEPETHWKVFGSWL